jgi:hypothetical protein
MKNKFDQKYFINLCKDIYKFRILDKGKYARPIFNFDYEKELIMGTSTAYGVELRLKRLKNKQILFCKKHGFHKLFRLAKKRKFIKCIKCDREKSIEYQKKIKLDPDFNKKRKQIELDKVVKFKASGKSFCEKHGYGSFFRIKVSRWKVDGVNKNTETLVCRKCDSEYGKDDRKNNPLKWCYINRKSERRKSIYKKFHLKYEDILLQYKEQNGRCYYTGIPLDKTKNRPSLERLDNEKEYTTQNVVITNFQSNQAKTDLSYYDFIKNIKLIYNHNFK